MNEKAIMFGERKSLVGIITEPSTTSAGRPIVIWLNSGVIHRIGPNRMTVHLARRLASIGFIVLRFDQSGVGDSPSRPGGLPFEESAQEDIQEAMNVLSENYGSRTFVLGGLCSGADNSYNASIRDKRVVGMCLIDGFAYPTHRSYLNHYGARLLSSGWWSRFIKRTFFSGVHKLQNVLSGRPTAKSVSVPRAIPNYVREFPARDKVASDLKSLIKRGVKMYWLYSGAMEVHNYRDQFRDAFSDIQFGSLLTLDHFADSNHTFTENTNQERLITTIVDWAGSSWPEITQPVPDASMVEAL